MEMEAQPDSSTNVQEFGRLMMEEKTNILKKTESELEEDIQNKLNKEEKSEKYLFQITIIKRRKKKKKEKKKDKFKNLKREKSNQTKYLIFENLITLEELKRMENWDSEALKNQVKIYFRKEISSNTLKKGWDVIKLYCNLKENGVWLIDQEVSEDSSFIKIRNKEDDFVFILKRKLYFPIINNFFSPDSVSFIIDKNPISRLFFVSDLHLSRKNNSHIKTVKENIHKYLESQNFDHETDLVVVLGDIAHNGLVEELLLVDELFDDKVAKRVLCLQGNHDVSKFIGLGGHSEKKEKRFLEMFFGQKKEVFPFVIRLEDNKYLILLDSNNKKKFHFSDGGFSKEQMKKLKIILEGITDQGKNKEVKIILGFHHHIYKDFWLPEKHIKNHGSISRKSREGLFSIVKEYHGSFTHMICGHRHLSFDHFLSSPSTIQTVEKKKGIRVVNLSCPFQTKSYGHRVKFIESNSFFSIDVESL